MKFNYVPSYDAQKGPFTGEEAVAFQMERDATLCDGQVERMQARIDSLSNMLGRLIDEMPSGRQADREALARVIGCNWEPTE